MIRQSLFAVIALGLFAAATVASDQPEPNKDEKPKADQADEFFEHGPIPHMRIELAPEELNKLRQDGRRSVPATVRETAGKDGDPETVYEKVAVHLKGGAGSYRDVDDKPGLTLNFASLAPGRQFHGLTKVHLNNCVQDPSYMSENLGNAIFRDGGVPATRVTYARVWINGRDVGLYVLKEGFDDVFLKRFFPEPRGTLYEGPFCRDVEEDLPARANESKKDPARLKELIAAAREDDADRRRDRLGRVLDVERFRSFMALEAMTAHWDGYCPNRNNYRIYHDLASDRLVFLPHGTDQLFQQTGFPLMPAEALVAQAATAASEDKIHYLERAAELRQKVFTPERLGERLDEISARLRPVMEELGPDAARRHKEETEGLRQRIAERVRDIDRQLKATQGPLEFDASGVASLAHAAWQEQTAAGHVTHDRDDEDGRSTLHIRVEGGDGEGTASYRAALTLPRGKYAFEGECRTAGVRAPGGANSGAGLRISGAQRTEGLSGDGDWRGVEFTFEVGEASRDVVLVCELKARAGEAWFDADTLKLRRR